MTRALEVRDLVKNYNGRPVVDKVSFEILPGEIVGILGPNGAGKTTAFYMTIGLIHPDFGQVFFQGEDVTEFSIDQRARMGMGYLAQEPSVFRNLTVEDNILCILETFPLTKQQRKERLEELLAELHLERLAKTYAYALSGGERRRLEITRAMVTNPSFLLLDEPFANIDPKSIEDVKLLITHLKEKQISVFITDHNAREIFSVVDRTYLMNEGKVLLSGSVEDLIHDKKAQEIYLGKEFRL